jgi:hypothetical protein
MGTGDNLRRYLGHSSILNKRTLGLVVPTNPSLLEGRERHWISALHTFDLLLYPLLNRSDLPFPSFLFDELRDEAMSQGLRAIVVIGVSIFRYTSTFEVVHRRAKPLVLSKGAILQLDGPADSEGWVCSWIWVVLLS